MQEESGSQRLRYVSYDRNGRTILYDNFEKADRDVFGLITVVDNRPKEEENNAMYVDKEFKIDENRLKEADSSKELSVKRICKLFPKKYRPYLFPEEFKPLKLKEKIKYPHFVYELQLFDFQFFRKLFITQQIAQNGKYEIIVNRDGRFDIEVIDDYVPVYKVDEESIWGLESTEPWQLLIAKVWAKKMGGYENVMNAKPFAFLEYFSMSNWKYFNLSLEGRAFLTFYEKKANENSKIIFKTKQSNEVDEAGLKSGIIGYELVNLYTDSKEETKLYFITLRTIIPHRWTGSLSIFDQQLKKTIQKIKPKSFNLQNTLILNQRDFLNLFSSAYITSQNMSPVYTNHYRYQVNPDYKSAKYFTFTIEKQGYFIYCIRQPLSNRIKMLSNKSRIQSREANEDTDSSEYRFLYVKEMLSRKIDGSNFNEGQVSESQLSKRIRRSHVSFEEKYNPLEFDSNEYDYKKGYNRGEAHFIRIIPGTYILRIKSQPISEKSAFTISYSSHQSIKLTEVNLDKQTSRLFIKDTIASISNTVPHKSYSKQNYEVISLGDLFNQLGYGFICLKVNKKCPYEFMLFINPKQLESDGYALKNEYKSEQQEFRIAVKPGDYAVVVLKKIKSRKQYIWPTSGFHLYSKNQ